MKYDVVIVGAGHNGLVCGAYLAKAGLKVCVLERRGQVGGACVTEEVWPGYKVSTAAHMLGLLQPRVILDLELQKFGYEVLTTPPIVQPIEGVGPVVLWRETDRLVKQFARFSQKDAAAYPEYIAHLARLGPVFRQLMWEIPFDPSRLTVGNLRDAALFAWRNKGLVGRFHEVADLLTMSAYDYLSRWFESDAVKAILGYYPAGGSGQSVGFHTEGTAYFLLRGYLRDNNTAAGGTGLVRGGMGTVSDAIARSGARFGMETRVDAEVARILVRDGKAEGVVLANGEEIRARLVVSNASARHTFLNLVDEAALSDEFLGGIRSFGGRATAFKVHLAVTELPKWDGIEASGFGPGDPSQVTIAPSVAYLEQAFADLQAGVPSRRPYLTVQAPSVVDPSLAPAGHHLMSIYGGHIPTGPGADQGEDTKEAVLNRVLETIRIFAPGWSGAYLHKQVMLAADYEAAFGLPGGNPHHADLTLSQLFFRRPAPRFSDHSTPVRDLYLSSASNHPGGGVTGIPGYNAARVVLKRLGRKAG
ncbi:oxidoreductase [Kaistia sp. 32K]|uniref:phytoene desaturase family protein n=1 Tax=Kaistia sp. 32K TaxID=2795690 RepID=UPI001915B9A0|nr:NAD(P)/FAD-dependent oxidoreductase [Kaistia sp. 32K]BCP52167.1 oxidoreductase [Kaistia sp. 32K]